jgi:hypothetical protein
MPAPAVFAMAKRAGWSAEKAERAWGKIKDAVVGAKLKSGKTIPANPDNWTDEMWAYVMGSLKNAMGEDTERMIDAVLEGANPSDVLQEIVDG